MEYSALKEFDRMECPKCHSIINENQAVCPNCRKVLLLECPNCHQLGEDAVCQSCGYQILVKCSKCSKINHIKDKNCKKCGFPTATSLAYQECDSDDFTAIKISCGNLQKIKKALKSKELYTKFYYKLKNLIIANTKSLEGKNIVYGDDFVINFNKELSFPTSANKAIRFAIKLVNVFVGLNNNILEEFGIPLNLTLTLSKKSSEELLEKTSFENNIKPLTIRKSGKKYLKGLQIIMDEYVRDEISKDFKTDSLYTVEENGKTVMFYELLLDSYIIPPSKDDTNTALNPEIKAISSKKQKENKKDLYSFKVFDINAKCKFETTNAINLFEKLKSANLEKEGKIITLRSDEDKKADIGELISFYEKEEYKVINVCCTKEMNYKPWGFFEAVFRDFYGLPFGGDCTIPNLPTKFKPLIDLVNSKAVKAMTPEDARYNYMEKWGYFLDILNKTVIIIDGFEYIDDTSLQTLEIYFDKFNKIKPNFVFITNKNISVHSKLKGLIRTPLYTEFTLSETDIDECLSIFKSDAGDFINSFFFEKIKENFNGSYLYFKNAIKFLTENDILIDFDNKILIKNAKSAVLPNSLNSLYKARLKKLGKDADISLLIAYSSMLSYRLDIETLRNLGLKDTDNAVKSFTEASLGRYKNGIIYIDNYNAISATANAALKKTAEEFLVKNIFSRLGKTLDDTVTSLLLGRLGAFKEEYLTLWKNSQFAIKTGDYDAYLKNCLGYLSLVEHIDLNVEKSVLEENKKEVYNNILMFLYNYSPAKIYFIENVLLMDAIEANDDDKIVKLSNLMLQGALISSNYTDALGLLHNILSRMKNPTLISDGNVNTKFLLLSLVNIEILYNIGDFRQCVEIAEEIISVLSPEIIEKVKPASFSINLFVSHIMDTLKLVGLAKLYMLDDDIDDFFLRIEKAMNADLPEKDCIIALREYLAGKTYDTKNIEAHSPYSKIVFLILQEFSVLKDDYKRFAQNVYQAKLLAIDIQQKEIELLCDLLIAFAYSKVNIKEKAESIYKDLLITSEKDAVFNILALTKYLLAKLYTETNRTEEGIKLLKEALTMIRKYDNQAQILFALCHKLFVEILKENNNKNCDIEIELNKLAPLEEKLSRILT